MWQRPASALEADELHLVGAAIGVDVHDGPDVSGFEAIGRDVGLQHDATMFLDYSRILPPRF
jgi:hypothetical protein